MKTKLLLTLLCCACAAAPLFPQIQYCEAPQAEPQQAENLDYKLLMHRDANLWTIFREPDEDDYIFIGGLWMSAQTPDGNLRVAAYDHSATLIPGDFWPGPLKDNGNPNFDWCPLFDRIWKISRPEIDAFIADWEDDNQLENPLPEVILTWPGSGNPFYFDNYAVSLPLGDLAPFFDRNGNQIYEPLAGDYPLIKGDAALWKVINDHAGPHSETQGDPLKIQARIMAYTFDSSDPLLSNTVFYNVSIQNRNPEPLQQFKASVWMENEWACPFWGRWTVQAAKNLAYFFNLYYPGDSCTTIPSPGLVEEWNYWHGLKLLQSPLEKDPVTQSQLSGVIYFRGSGTNNPPPGTSNPYIDVEYNRYMSNLWRDGSPFTYGGDAYQSGAPVPFVFPDPLNDTLGWSACTTEWPVYEVHSLVNFPLGDFAPGEKKSFDLAFFRIPAPQPLCSEPGVLSQPADLLQMFWENEVVTATNIPFPETIIQIIPNPAKGEFAIRCSPASGSFSWNIWNLQGKKMTGGQNNQVQVSIPAEDWAPGMYLVEALFENGERKMAKVVVE